MSIGEQLINGILKNPLLLTLFILGILAMIFGIAREIMEFVFKMRRKKRAKEAIKEVI